MTATAAANQEEDDQEAENGTDPSAAAATAPSNPRQLFTTSTILQLEKTKNRRFGDTEKPPQYSSSSKSNAIATSLSTEDLRLAVSATTRLLLARQLNGKPLTGSEICQIALSKLAGVSEKKDFNKLLLGYVRVQVAKRLKDVFGFELFAGPDESELILSDKWQIVNAIENDELRILLGSTAAATREEGDEEEEESQGQHNVKNENDEERGILMIVLATIMMHKDSASHKDLEEGLNRFGLSLETDAEIKRRDLGAKSIKNLMTKFVKTGMVEREAKKNASTTHVYQTGQSALNEIGRRNILLFMIQSCKVQLDDLEEAGYLQVQVDETV